MWWSPAIKPLTLCTILNHKDLFIYTIANIKVNYKMLLDCWNRNKIHTEQITNYIQPLLINSTLIWQNIYHMNVVFSSTLMTTIRYNYIQTNLLLDSPLPVCFRFRQRCVIWIYRHTLCLRTVVTWRAWWRALYTRWGIPLPLGQVYHCVQSSQLVGCV